MRSLTWEAPTAAVTGTWTCTVPLVDPQGKGADTEQGDIGTTVPFPVALKLSDTLVASASLIVTGKLRVDTETGSVTVRVGALFTDTVGPIKRIRPVLSTPFTVGISPATTVLPSGCTATASAEACWLFGPFSVTRPLVPNVAFVVPLMALYSATSALWNCGGGGWGLVGVVIPATVRKPPKGW